MHACVTCGKSKGRKFREDSRYLDGRSPFCETCRGAKLLTDAATMTTLLRDVDDADRLQLIQKVFEALPTVDIDAVPILAAGGPYFGTGSPPEGDFFTKADLEKIAEQTNRLEQAGELRPPSKLGHSEEQRLLNNSGMPVTDELPAAGWLTNFRVEKLAGIWKLLADVKQVPAKLGQVLAAGGYRCRSVELSRVVSQVADPGAELDGVVTGLAWLGAKAPAVRTLDDIWNLYAVGDVVWEEEDGIMDLLSDLTAAINMELAPDEPSYMWEMWVNDVNLKLNKCTASDWSSDTTWIIGFKVGAGNEPTVDAREKWVPSTMKLVEIDPAAADTLGGGSSAMPDDEGEYTATGRYGQMRREARAKFIERTADTKGMKLTDKQVAELAKVFSIDGEGDELRAKVEEHLETTVAPEAEAAPVVAPTVEPIEPVAELTQALSALEVPAGADQGLVKAVAGAVVNALAPTLTKLSERAERGDQAFTNAFTKTGNDAIFRAIGEGRLNPADREQYAAFYAAQPELCLKQLETLPVNPLLLLTYGTDNDGLTLAEHSESDQAVEDAYLAATGATLEGAQS